MCLRVPRTSEPRANCTPGPTICEKYARKSKFKKEGFWQIGNRKLEIDSVDSVDSVDSEKKGL